MRTGIATYIHNYIHTHEYIQYVNAYIHAYIQTYIHAYINNIYIHAYIQLYIHTDIRTYRHNDCKTIVGFSECRNESWCEARSSSDQRSMYCYIYITFWVSFRSPMVAIGVQNDRSRQRRMVLTSWTPPPLSDVQLDLINYVGFSHEMEEINFLLSRDAGKSVTSMAASF